MESVVNGKFPKTFRFGRKKTCITCLFSSGLCLLVIAVFPHSTEEKGKEITNYMIFTRKSTTAAFGRILV